MAALLNVPRKMLNTITENSKESIRILDVIKENPKLKPGTVLDIGPDGEKLARKTAEKTVKIIGDKS